MPKIAISISKHIGNAVVRNYEQRVHREIIRAMMCDLEHLEILFVIKQKRQTFIGLPQGNFSQFSKAASYLHYNRIHL